MKAETGTKKLSSKSRNALIGKIVLYVVLLIITALMVVPFLWMLSASIKSNREVFIMDPFVWIPEVPRWQNYVDIWTKIPLLKFVQNTVILTIIVTFLQLLTSSFAAYRSQSLNLNIKTPCSWLILQQSQCHGRYIWCLSSL